MHLLPAFGGRKLASITASDVARYVSGKRGDYKGWTIKSHLAVLSGIFTHGIRNLGLRGMNAVSLLDKVERSNTENAASTASSRLANCAGSSPPSTTSTG
jgi:hypothetical protein